MRTFVIILQAQIESVEESTDTTVNEEEGLGIWLYVIIGAAAVVIVVVIVVIGVVLPCFSTWTVLIPMFFPRIAIAFRPLFDKKKS